MGKLSVCLLPVSTSTILFHEHIQPNASEIRFLNMSKRFMSCELRDIYVYWYI